MGRTIIYDAEGKRVAVRLPIQEYERLIDDSEDLEDLQEYLAAKASGEHAIPFTRRTPRSEDRLYARGKTPRSTHP